MHILNAVLNRVVKHNDLKIFLTPTTCFGLEFCLITLLHFWKCSINAMYDAIHLTNIVISIFHFLLLKYIAMRNILPNLRFKVSWQFILQIYVFWALFFLIVCVSKLKILMSYSPILKETHLKVSQ